MAITRGFRPTQHVYQSTYRPFPFEQIAPIAMQKQQEHMAGARKVESLVDTVEDIPRAKADAEMAEREINKVRERVTEVAKKNPEFRGPEFESEINKVARDLKNNKLLQASALNAKMEPEWEKVINDDSIPLTNRYQLAKQYAEFQSKGTEGFGVLGEPTTPEYVDYQERLEKVADDFLPQGWKRAVKEGDFEQMMGENGIDPRSVANILGFNIKNGQIDPNSVNIPTFFYNSDAGEQLRRDAFYEYDTLKNAVEAGAVDGDAVVTSTGKTAAEVTLGDIENEVYYETAAKLVPKHSGFSTQSMEGREDPTLAEFNSFKSNIVGLLGTEQGEKVAQQYEKSGILGFIYKVSDYLPEGMNIMGALNGMMQNAKEQGISEEQITKYIDDLEASISEGINSNASTITSVGEAVVPGFTKLTGGGDGLASMIANTLIAPLRYSQSRVAPTEEGLDVGQYNHLNKLLSENEDLKTLYDNADYTEDGRKKVPEKVWRALQDNAVDFYKEGVYVNLGYTKGQLKDIVSFTDKATELLFGKDGADGKVTFEKTDEGLTGPGAISNLPIIDQTTGKIVAFDELDLPADKEINVRYKGSASPDNPYAPNLANVHINGKDYFVVLTPDSSDQIDEHHLNSFKYNHTGIGKSFVPTAYDENKVLGVTPSKNYINNKFEITVDAYDSTGELQQKTYESAVSIEDAYSKFLKDSMWTSAKSE